MGFYRVYRMFRPSRCARGRKQSAIRLLFCGFLACCTVAFFVSSVRLSVAPAYPCLKGHSRPGRLSKLDRASEAGIEAAFNIVVEGQPERLPEPPPAFARLDGPAAAVPGMSRYLRSFHFRSPPAY